MLNVDDLKSILLFVNIRFQFFNLAILCFLSIAILLFGFMMIFMQIKIMRDKKLQKWKLMAELLARKAIFFEEEDNIDNGRIAVTQRLNNLLGNLHFRKILTDELINARKNVTGAAAENLKRVYLQLNLQTYAFTRLKNFNWYIKAQAIQELSVMELKEALTKIYRFTNNSNDLLRMESQVAVVKFYGFEGLRFLDVVSYPITEWQQIKLLTELSLVSAKNFHGVEKWLKSKNKSIIAFTLKLVRNYHLFEFHDRVASCLEDEDADVRIQAIYTLGEIYTYNTSTILINCFLLEDDKHKAAVLKVLQNIASETDIPVLLEILNTKNIDHQLMTAKALVKIGPRGLACLEHHRHAMCSPLKQVIAQVKTEV